MENNDKFSKPMQPQTSPQQRPMQGQPMQGRPMPPQPQMQGQPMAPQGQPYRPAPQQGYYQQPNPYAQQQMPPMPPQQPARPQVVVDLTAESKFTGGLLGLIGINIVCLLLTCTLIGIPFAICLKESWLIKHTVINGCHLEFDGNGAQLFGSFIKWVLLSLITFGIYGLWLPIKINNWKTKHTHVSPRY